jgi:hypothetical protein
MNKGADVTNITLIDIDLAPPKILANLSKTNVRITYYN